MKILLTGATGFIGRHVGKALRLAGHRVVTLARSNADLNIDVTRLSPADAPAVDAIIHLAGLADAGASNDDPAHFLLVNAVGTLRALEVARVQRCRIVLASSMRVYHPAEHPLKEEGATAPPTDAYGYSKLTAELWGKMYSQLYESPVTALRFFSVYGPGQSPRASGSGVVAIFAHRALAGEKLVVYNRQARDFVHVEDVARAVLTALERDKAGWQAYNVATGRRTTVAELAGLVVEAAGGQSEVDLSMADRPGDSYLADVTKARAELGFTAEIALSDGIGRYIDWLKQEMGG